MIVSFFSNYLTHHQIPFCEEMSKMADVEFHFVSTMPMEQERSTGGWKLNTEYGYEIRAYANEETSQEALRLARDSDVVIIGSAPEVYVQYRMKHAPCKLTLRYSEHIYKRGRWCVLSPRGALLRLNTYFRYWNKPLYMLCASAYTAGDLAMLGSYIGKCFKWGYFPATRKYPALDRLIEEKIPVSILWVARMINWKHPEAAIEVAWRLKQEGYTFRLDMIGTGQMEQSLREQVAFYGLSEQVHLLGTMTPDQVREQMEKHRIFLFTSDHEEGWGAVLNESMNSGCAVVADHRIGSVPFLIKDGENGFSYDGTEQLYCRVKQLLDDPQMGERIGAAAYTTITEKWCAAEAAKRLYSLCENLQKGNKIFEADGPCSKAPVCIKKRRK